MNKEVGRIRFTNPAAHEPSPSTRSRPDGGHPLRGALPSLPELIAIACILLIWAGTFHAIWRLA